MIKLSVPGLCDKNQVGMFIILLVSLTSVINLADFLILS